MGGLGHIIESAGIATTQISLIREHTQTIKPPRALWVPFEFGRPLGTPNQPELQRRILTGALSLLTSDRCPILEEFEYEVPKPTEKDTREKEASPPAAASPDESMPVACPVRFGLPVEPSTSTEKMMTRFLEEVVQMRNWYDIAVEKRGRTTFGITGLEPERIARFFSDFVESDGALDHSPMEGIAITTALRMAAEDLKAYYFEGVTAQPGQPTDSQTLSTWFWRETTAGQVINTIRILCLKSDNKSYGLLGKLLLVPRNQLDYFDQNR